ncbi:hypothetical protein, partial [Nocardia arizonensis]
MIELPSGLHWLSVLAGMEWPEGNEHEMWSMAGDWRTAAADLREIVDDIYAAKDAAHKAYPHGEGAEDMLKAFDSLARGDGGDKDQSLNKLADFFDQVGESVYQTGTEIEYTKIMFYSSLGLLAAELAAAWLFPPTAPAVEAAAIGATRIAARIITGRVIAAIIRAVAKAAATRLVKFIARHVVIDTVIGTLQELGVQQWQKDHGHRKEIDWNQVKAAAVSSAAGGAAAGPFGHWLGNTLSKEMKPWLRGAITGTAAGLVGAGGGMLGQFGYDAATVGLGDAWNNLKTAATDPLMWSAGATNGGLSGFNKSAATSAWQGMKPGLFERPSLSSRIAQTLGPDVNLGGFGQDGAGNHGAGNNGAGNNGTGDGSTNRTGDNSTQRAGDAQGDGAGRTSGEGTRAGATGDTTGNGSGETRAGDGTDGQNVRPAGTTDAPPAEGDTMSADTEGQGEQRAGADQQSAADGSGTSAGRQESRPDTQGADTQATADSGARAQPEAPQAHSDAPAAQTDSGPAQQESRTGAADDSGTADTSRADTTSSGEPVTRTTDTETGRHDTTTQSAAAPLITAAGAPTGIGAPPSATGHSPGQAPAQGHSPAASGQPSATPTHTTNTPNQSATPTQQANQSTPGQGGADRGAPSATRPGGPEVRADGPRANAADTTRTTSNDPRASAPDRDPDGPPTDDETRGPVDGRAGTGGQDTRAGEVRAGAPESRAGAVDTPHEGARAAHTPTEAPRTGGESESAADPVRATAAGAEPHRTGTDPAADVPPVLPVADHAAPHARPGADASRPVRGGEQRGGPDRTTPHDERGPAAHDDDAPHRDRDGTSDDRQPWRDANGNPPVYDARLPSGEGVIHHPTGTSVGEDNRTHRVRENIRNDGAHDVVVHGRRDGFPAPGNNFPVHPQDIVDAIRDNPHYRPGTAVRLVSCHAGNAHGWAQYISDRLGVEVHAPTDKVGVPRSPDSDPRIANGGEWRTFRPQSGPAVGDHTAPLSDRGDTSTRRHDGEGQPRDPEPAHHSSDRTDWMDTGDDDPPRDPASSHLVPPDGSETLPRPSVDAQLLGTIDESRVTRDPESNLITHVDGEFVDDFARRLSSERAAEYVRAGERDPDLAQRLRRAEEALDAAAHDRGEAKRALEAAGPEDKRAAVDAMRAAQDRFAETRAELQAAKRAVAVDDANRLSRHEMGEVSALTVDRVTGHVYEAANGPSDRVVADSDLHETLRHNLDEVRRNGPYSHENNGPKVHDYPHPDQPLGHAEVRTTNALLHHRGALGIPNGPESLHSVLNAPHFPRGGAKGDAAYCANCAGTLHGTETATGSHSGYPPSDSTYTPPARHSDAAAGEAANPDRTHDHEAPVRDDAEPIRPDDDVDFMGDDDPPPVRPSAMSHLDPGTGTDNAPASREAGVEPHLLGTLPVPEDGPITHVDGEHIDDFARRLAEERYWAFHEAASPHPDIVQRAADASELVREANQNKDRAVGDLRDAKTKVQEAKNLLDRADDSTVEQRQADLDHANRNLSDATAKMREAQQDAAHARRAQSAANRALHEALRNLPLSGNDRGAVMAVTVDRVTGRVYEAANGPAEHFMHYDDLHHLLQDNLDRAQPSPPYRTHGHDPAVFIIPDNPLGHAEVKSTNAALLDRTPAEMARGGEDPLASIMNVPMMMNGTERGEVRYCSNCDLTLRGTESVTGRIEAGPGGDRHIDHIPYSERESGPPERVDFMGDDDPDTTGPHRTLPGDQTVPAGMTRGDDGLLRRPGDRADSYRDPDGTWHHRDDPPNSFRGENFRLRGDNGAFLGDHLTDHGYTHDAQRGDARTYEVRDPHLAEQLHDASTRRLELQTERDAVAVELDRLKSEFGVEHNKELAPKRLTDRIQQLEAEIVSDPSLSEAEVVNRLTDLADLEDTARRYNDLGREMVDFSKRLGELAGLGYALDSDLHPDAVLLTPFAGAFDGAGVVDVASMVHARGVDPTTLVVVEAKGVGSELGGSKTISAQQGSPEYLRHILGLDRNLARILNETPEQMRARGIDPDSREGRNLRAAVDALRAARDDGTLRVGYRLVHAAADGTVTVTELRLVRDGTNVLADVPLPFEGAPPRDLATTRPDEVDFMGDDAGEQRPHTDFDEPSRPEREVRIELGDNGEVVALHVRLEDGRWVVARADESPRNLPEAGGDRPVDNRNVLRRLVDQLNAGYEGLTLKYPSGSGLDGRGQTAVRDGLVGGVHLVTDPPAPTPHPAPHPTPTPHPTGPEVHEPPPGPADPALNVARIGKEGATVWQNREHLPLVNGATGRVEGVAGEHHPVNFPDGTEYRPWITEADPNLLRENVVTELEAGRMSADEARSILLETLDRTTDPRVRQELINDLEIHNLVDFDHARDLETTAPQEAAPPPEPDEAAPEGESLTDMANRMGFDLDDESPQALRRAIDEQSYRVLREVGAIEGLADAARRANEEQTRPYGRVQDSDQPAATPDGRTLPDGDHTPPRGELGSDTPRRRDDTDLDNDDYGDDFEDYGDEPNTRRGHWGDTSEPRPVPFSREVSFLDDNPMGRFLRDLIVAFDGNTVLRDYERVGNGADRLPEWGDIADSAELGRDQGPRAFFEHALRRDQLRDELSGWAAMFGRDLSDLTGEHLDRTLAELRDAAARRAQNLADFISAAEPILRGDEGAPVGRTYGDQVARVPDPHGGPDRLIVTDGPLDRSEALARALDGNEDLARGLRDRTLQLDYRTTRTDGSGQVHLDPVATPEVRHVRATIDGADLDVTLVRGEDGQWHPVQAPPETPPPPRDRGEIVREIRDLVQELGLTPTQLHPDNIAGTIADLHLDNAVRAAQVEALADYARTMSDIESFHLIGDARGQLAARLGLTEAELTPRRLAAALADPNQRRALREQQFEDLLDGPRHNGKKTEGYSRQLELIDSARVRAAQDALIRALSPDNPDSLRPKIQKKGPHGRHEYTHADHGIDPRELRNRIMRLQRRGQHDLVLRALTDYADTLLGIDPYSGVPKGDHSADPRTTGEPHVYDLDAVHGLREVIGEIMPGIDPREFASRVADNAARAYGQGEPTEPNGPRPRANRDWARLVGVDLSTADDATFRKIYEAYRDGKIEKHEGLSPAELEAEVARMREEIRTRAEQIRQLRSLTEELYRPVADLPPSGPPAREHPDGPTPDLDGPGGDRRLPSDGDPGASRPHNDSSVTRPDGVDSEAAADAAALESYRRAQAEFDAARAELGEARRGLLSEEEAAADAAAHESYLRAQAEFDAARADVDARFGELLDRAGGGVGESATRSDRVDSEAV